MAAGGMGLINAPVHQAGIPRRMALLGSILETSSLQLMERRLGMVAEPYHRGRAGQWMKAGKALAVIGTVAAGGARRGRLRSACAGSALVAASLCTLFGVFHAGLASANDPKYTVVPQRQRREANSA